MNEQEQFQALGRIEGKMDMMLQNQKRQDDKLEELDGRLRAVEVKAATTGAIAGTLASLLTSAGVSAIRAKFGL
ncbi:hypothetical protein [Cupriavidus gilardii]|uniref:Uncharacterized protein n=1 Tax=Cupriavidus gilardii TaxID=82541 RepID=A0ABY4VLH4_9BURK|nr:hypothetical protein [Cupriavidus gilardii]NSX04818.1 hypothetical protein [Cupriavidus gilardii]USE78077.1 hypothetical protein NDR89_03245 [Cupriavidus gilardii]UXC35146.1 hypothetical protein N4G38_12095 [Cupriavidus gilardii]